MAMAMVKTHHAKWNADSDVRFKRAQLTLITGISCFMSVYDNQCQYDQKSRLFTSGITAMILFGLVMQWNRGQERPLDPDIL